MKAFILALFLYFLTQESFAFLLMSAAPPRYSSNEVTVMVGSADCLNFNKTQAELKSLAQEAFDELWNDVPTSNIKLTVGADLSIDPTDTVTTILNNNVVGDTILLYCSQNSSTNNFTSPSTLGLGTIDSSTGSTKGIAALNNTSGTSVANLNDSQVKALIAHEVGHALGIAHSNVDYALMYFQSNDIQEKLTEDDADAISFLYPADEPLSCVLGKLSLDDISKKDDPPGPGFLILALGFLISLLGFRLAIRHKASLRPMS